MRELDVRIERLPKMWVAAVNSYGEAPEAEAWRVLREWAGPKGWLSDPAHPIFGFNNPPPAPDNKAYGYELWIGVNGPQEEEGIRFEEFAGGLFAVTASKLKGDPDIATTWRLLWDWAQKNGSYCWRHSHELEKVLNPEATEEEMVLDLYLPVGERTS